MTFLCFFFHAPSPNAKPYFNVSRYKLNHVSVLVFAKAPYILNSLACVAGLILFRRSAAFGSK